MLFFDHNGPFHECARQFMFVKNLSELCYQTTMNGGEKNLHYVLNQNRQVRTAVFESKKVSPFSIHSKQFLRTCST